MAVKPCLDCGTLSSGSRCPACARARTRARNQTNPYRTGKWRTLARKVVARAGHCATCGSTHRLTAHHDIPRTAGGADHASNLIVLCAPCHSRLEAARRKRPT